MSYYNPGPSPLTLFVVGSIVVGGLIVGDLAYESSASTTRRENAITEAREWATTMYPNEHIVTVVCQGQDTNSDGYVSCTVRIGTNDPMPIECASYVLLNYNNGCRAARIFPLVNNSNNSGNR